MSPPKSLILLNPDSRITCPNCQQTFAVGDGFARIALEQVEAASAETLAQLREEERAAAAERLAGERHSFEQRLS